MITLTLVERVSVNKRIEQKRVLKLFHSMDKAKKFIVPVVKEMKEAKADHREPKIRIDAVSYDEPSEKAMLLQLDAIISIENE